MTGRAVADALRDREWTWRTEDDLQQAVEQRLLEVGLAPEREVRLGPRDRVDLLVGTVAVEVKVAGNTERLLRQVMRYAESPRVEEIVVVTSRERHRHDLPVVAGGKPLHVVVARGAL